MNISKKEYENYRRLLDDKNNGRVLTPDGLRFLCEANKYDPEKIGRVMLETYAKFKSQGVIK